MADDLLLFVSSILNLFISGLFMGLSIVVLRRAEEEGTVIWVDLGKTLVMVGACLVAQSLVVASVAMFPLAVFKFLWFVVFILFSVSGLLVARYCYRTNKMLTLLIGGG